MPRQTPSLSSSLAHRSSSLPYGTHRISTLCNALGRLPDAPKTSSLPLPLSSLPGQPPAHAPGVLHRCDSGLKPCLRYPAPGQGRVPAIRRSPSPEREPEHVTIPAQVWALAPHPFINKVHISSLTLTPYKYRVLPDFPFRTLPMSWALSRRDN